MRHTLRAILASSLDEVLVVIGHEAEAIRETITDLPVRIVFNCNFALGQSTSVRAGLDALPPEAEAVVFLLGDQPGVDPIVIDTLIADWRETDNPIVAPQYADGLGNPVLFDRSVLPELLTIDGDQGAKPIVRAFQRRGLLRTVAVRRPAPPDVDTEDDYATLLAATKSLSPRARGEGSG